MREMTVAGCPSAGVEMGLLFLMTRMALSRGLLSAGISSPRSVPVAGTKILRVLRDERWKNKKSISRIRRGQDNFSDHTGLIRKKIPWRISLREKKEVLLKKKRKTASRAVFFFMSIKWYIKLMEKKGKKTAGEYVVGVDSGGTKTVCVLADASGRIIKRTFAGPANPNKVGYNNAIIVLGKIIRKTVSGVDKKDLKSVYIALAGNLERDAGKKEVIAKDLAGFSGLAFLSGKIKVDGDQKAAFRAGTDTGNGILVIAGTGSIVMGWKREKEAISGGWDYILGDDGSAFWVGQEALKDLCKALDGRLPEISGLGKLILKDMKIRKESDLLKNIYGENLVEVVASVSRIVDGAAREGDGSAKKILEEGAMNLAVSVFSVLKKLNFRKGDVVSVVFVGGMFKSLIFRKRLESIIKKRFPRAAIILPQDEPVMGAVRLAIENLK